jgi:hypothetical protein
MPRIIIAVDVDAVEWMTALTDGETRELARQMLAMSVSTARGCGLLWEREVTVVPVRYEIDGQPTVLDSRPPF